MSNRLRTRSRFWGGQAGSIPVIGPGYISAGLTFSRASAASYFDGAGVLQTVGNDAPRWPDGLGRLLIEGARSNGVRNPWAVGGGPGAAPTNWTVDLLNATGVTATPLGVVNVRGTPVLEIQISGTASVAGFLRVFSEAANVIVAELGQAWAGSIYTQSVGLIGVGPAQISIDDRTAAGGYIAGSTTNVSGPGDYLSRVHATRILAGAAVARTQAYYRLTIPAGATVSGVLRIGLPMMEQGAFPSTPGLPAPGAIQATTRAADSLSGLIAALGLPATGFTLSGRASIPQAAPIDQTILQIDAGADANRIRLFNAAGGAGISLGRTTGGAGADAVLGSTVPGTDFGWAVAVNLAAGTASACIQGGAVQQVSGGPGSLSTLRIGNNVAGDAALFGALSMAARNSIVPDADLPALAAGAV
ncbi:hypothetical protein [Roseococcus pinisoli]|uniref:Uncharacterized protein n=1 Tax=Roseococcus pinisoli TaxID=2835040 RepID=A0ABS5QCH1_9PROT|nr:hypothetical protein [Roseococcus pinisoli]MBS7811217.1 hypothetical protein [Roseococcus pinisoli]